MQSCKCWYVFFVACLSVSLNISSQPGRQRHLMSLHWRIPPIPGLRCLCMACRFSKRYCRNCPACQVFRRCNPRGRDERMAAFPSRFCVCSHIVCRLKVYKGIWSRIERVLELASRSLRSLNGAGWSPKVLWQGADFDTE